MLVDRHGPLHLTYCTNIHPADGWEGVLANLRRFGPALKQRFAPDRPFGLGLRLSRRDASELLDGQVDAFRAFLDGEGLYVALINGFPYGAFHRSVVKADVYAPDWRDPERAAYTLDLITILARLLPPGVDGGVSTAPLSYKAWMAAGDDEGWRTATAHVVRVAERLVRLREEKGISIHLDIEPEPDCAIENTDEAIAFFERWLLPYGAPRLADATGTTVERAQANLLEHVRLCFDCCHFAVEYEDPAQAIARLERAGIRIGRVQLSSAIRVEVPAEPREAAAVRERLRAFADPVYLHQVIERRDGALRHFADLGPALDEPAAGADEWRIHFHVPLFARDYDGLASTQSYVRDVIAAVRARPFTTHLEIETYTWDVLPAGLKADLLESIGREYEWVLGQLMTAALGGSGLEA